MSVRALSLLTALLPILATALPATAAEPAAGTVTIADPYVRAVPPGQPNSAAFMTLTNSGAGDRAVVAAASPAANVVELHTHRMEDGMMQMRRIERIDLPAGASVELKPGGLHVMLIDLTGPLTPGAEVPLTLTLDDGTSLALTAPVRMITTGSAAGPGHQGHQGH